MSWPASWRWPHSRQPEASRRRLLRGLPYVVSYGWPTWVSGRPAEQYLDSGAWLDQEFRAAGLPEKGLTPEVVVLTEAERLRKGETIAEYRSQLPALRLDPTRIGIQQNLLHYEVRWSVDPAALELLVQECRAELDL
ncbi:hypothetical protein GXW82_32135 [Streptacidiphilus sp. 4-A2]|nr:hypothetical protein [Streptacidiphilus sp. 4-A2]